MAKFEVDLSRVPPKDQHIDVPMIIKPMPLAPGNAKAGLPVPQRNASPPPVVAGVSRAATQHPAIPELRVPATSEYIPPPEKVVAEPSHPATGA